MENPTTKNEYLIYVSDNYNAEDLFRYKVKTEKPLETVIKAAMLQALYDREITSDKLERLCFGKTPVEMDGYTAYAELSDYHISVWCDNSKSSEFDLSAFYKRAEMAPDNEVDESLFAQLLDEENEEEK